MFEEPRAGVVHLLYRANLAKHQQDVGAVILAAQELDALEPESAELDNARRLMLDSLLSSGPGRDRRLEAWAIIAGHMARRPDGTLPDWQDIATALSAGEYKRLLEILDCVPAPVARRLR